MSLLRSTIEAFPRGRTTGELFVLLGADFDNQRRAAIMADLDELARDRIVARGRDGLWRSLVAPVSNPPAITPGNSTVPGGEAEPLCASPARFQSRLTEETAAEIPGDQDGPADPEALLRYWRSALRADPDGSLTVRLDASGHLELAWHLYQWGDQVEVLAPEALKDLVAAHRRADFPALP